MEFLKHSQFSLKIKTFSENRCQKSRREWKNKIENYIKRFSNLRVSLHPII